MIKRRSTFTSIVDNDSTFDNEDINKITAYWNFCESLGFYHKLGPRIYPNKDQPIPHDSDNWLQCYNCGQITPKTHAKQQNEIAPIVDPPSNIHDSNKVVVIPTKGIPSHNEVKKLLIR